MQRFWRLFFSFFIVVALGVADLPRPCTGDGLGNACGPTACTCLKSCTCYLEHELTAYYASFPCCKVDDQALGAAQNRPLPNLALPLKQWDVVAPAMPVLPVAALPRGALAGSTPWIANRPAAPLLPAREKPPRLAA